MTIDKKAFRSLSCGLFVVSATNDDGLLCGCVVNTVLQVASAPATLLVSVNKDCATCRAIQESGHFTASTLSEDSTMDLIGTFGFRTSTEVAKFEEFECSTFESGRRYLTHDMLSAFDVDVTTVVDVGTHLVFIGVVKEAVRLEEGTPLTYDHYHRVIKGKTPEKAASYNDGDDPTQEEVMTAERIASEPKIAWRCKICGFTVEGYPDGLPEDFKCPMCGMGREVFEKVLV